MADLSIQVREVDGVAVLEPAGFINAHTVRQFEGSMERLVEAGEYSVLLNCRDLA